MFREANLIILICLGLLTACKKNAGEPWTLVVRKFDAKTGKNYEVWRDNKSGLLWGDRLDALATNYVEMAPDDARVAANEAICASEAGKRANGQLKSKFTLPSREDFETAEKHGIREVLPNLKGNWFWSSTVHKENRYYAYFFDGDGKPTLLKPWQPLHAELSIRCVSRYNLAE